MTQELCNIFIKIPQKRKHFCRYVKTFFLLEWQSFLIWHIQYTDRGGFRGTSNNCEGEQESNNLL